MKTKNSIFFIILLIIFANPLFSSEKINLSQSSADSTNPSIAINPRGEIMVVWVEMDWPIKGIADILYVTHQNGEWTIPKESLSQLYDASLPHLVSGPGNKLHLTYADGKDILSRDIFYRIFSFEENLWSNIQRVYLSESDSSWPKIEVDKKGKIHVMWVHQYGDKNTSDVVLNSKNKGGIWPEAYENVSQEKNFMATHPSFKLKNRNIYACWEDNRNGTWDLFYNEKIEGIWKLPTSLNFYGEKCWPSLVLDKENKVHIIYCTKEGGVYHVKRVNQQWQAPVLLSTNLSPVGATDLKLFKDNTLHAVWKQESNSGISIFYSRATSDGNWIKPIEAAKGKEADNPCLALDDYGNAHIVWGDSGTDANKDIFYAKVTPSGMKPSASLSSSEDTGIVPFKIDFDASESTPGEGDILSYWWDFGDGSEMVQGKLVSHSYKRSGNFLVKLYVTNSLLLVGFESKEIEILSGPFPPINIRVEKTENGGLFYREKINGLTWEENPKNKGMVTILYYNIYRKLKNRNEGPFKRIGQVNGLTFKFVDRDFISPEERDLFTYAVSAVDSKGGEGPKGIAVSYQ